MKCCSKCGKELLDDAVICPECGCQVDNEVEIINGYSDGVKVAVRIFLILGIIGIAAFTWLAYSMILIAINVAFVFLFPVLALPFALATFAWTIPMTVHTFKCLRKKKRMSKGFKVCILLFVSVIAGILLLSCDDGSKQ